MINIKRIPLTVIFFLFLGVFLIGCTPQAEVEPPQPSAVILSAVKVYSGSSQSIRVTYRLNNITEVERTLIANLNYGFSGAANVEIPTVDGEAIVYDHGNSSTSANYYFILIMRDGSQRTTTIQTFYF